MSEDIIVQMVQGVRARMPRIGGKKLYFMLKEDLMKLDKKTGRDKFFNILRDNELLVQRKRNYARTTDSYHRFNVYNNLLKSRLLSRSNECWVADITYLRTMRGFVYLFLLTDAFSRKIVGWSLSHSLSIEGGIEALKMALKQRGKSLNLIHHSDRGIQYCSKEYVALLKENGIDISMTEENHCYENSLAERVNGILKDEFLLDETFKDSSLCAQAVKEAVSIYNYERPHLSLNYKTPQTVHQAQEVAQGLKS